MSAPFVTAPAMLSSFPEKRFRSHHLDQRSLKRSFASLSTSNDFCFSKKSRTAAIDSEFSSCLSSMVDEPALTLPSVTTDSFDFGGMVPDFGADSCLPNPDSSQPILDSFLVDLPVAESICVQTREETSNVTPVSDAGNVLPIFHTSAYSPVSSASPPPSPPSTGALLETSEQSPAQSSNEASQENKSNEKETDIDRSSFHEKRLADRAARNRESSRRAREKAKQRLRALENQNRSLLDMVQHYKMQNEELYSQLHRARTLQQSCSVCSYNVTSQRAALSCAQQPQPQNAVRCAAETRRQQMRLDPSYRATV